MTSLILRTATRYLFVPLMIFSIYILLRGHHLPGGGFVGGLLAGAAFTLFALAFDVASARKKLRAEPVSLAVAGLAIACSKWISRVVVWGAIFDRYLVGNPVVIWRCVRFRNTVTF